MKHLSGDSWMYPYQRTPIWNPYSTSPILPGYLSRQESLQKIRKNTMGTLLGVHPTIPWGNLEIGVYGFWKTLALDLIMLWLVNLHPSPTYPPPIVPWIWVWLLLYLLSFFLVPLPIPTGSFNLPRATSCDGMKPPKTNLVMPAEHIRGWLFIEIYSIWTVSTNKNMYLSRFFGKNISLLARRVGLGESETEYENSGVRMIIRDVKRRIRPHVRPEIVGFLSGVSPRVPAWLGKWELF